MSDRETRALANELARLRRRLDRFETNQQSWARSVEEAALDFYDENDLLRLSVGRQDDGSYGIRYPEGEPPPKPSEPDVVSVGDGVVVVTWDGRFDERFSAGEFRNLRVHIDEGDPAFVPTRSNQVGAIWARRGGSIVAVTGSDVDNPVYVKFVATNQAGQWSPESDAVLVDETDSDNIGEEVDEELEFWQDGPWTITAAGAQDLTLTAEPEKNSEHFYVNGVAYAEADGWSRNGRTISATAGLLRVGDVVNVEYAVIGYGVAEPLIPWDATGWKYLPNVAAGDTDTSRAAVGFDDSTWATGAAPFQWNSGNSLKLWMRKWFPPAVDVYFHADIEDHGNFYINGTLVVSQPYKGSGTANNDRTITYKVPNSLINQDADNLIAIEAIDDNYSVSYANCELWGTKTR